MVNTITSTDLLKLERPAQYIGGELNSVIKNESDVELRFCLAFPDIYEVGMSHIGIQILYSLINDRQNWWAERVYCPKPDMESLLRKKSLLLTSLESKRPLKNFDVIGFSLQYELCMTGILQILDLGGIPFRATERNESHPIIIAGGPVSFHPEPMADFFDCFLIGDGEELTVDFNTTLLNLKKLGVSRLEILKQLALIPGIYVPQLYTPMYSESGKYLGMKSEVILPLPIKKRLLPTLENAPYPTKPVVPNIQAIHDRLSVEVMRGCVRGCRFCQAGYLYRPQRERSPEDIMKIVGESLNSTGYEELSLLSLSTADYCSIMPLLKSITDKYAANDELAISFPSTRVDALKPELLEQVQKVRRTGFTIAPEAGTQRLRDVINKGVSDDQIIETCTNVFKLGWDHVKLYFMIGLPTETDEDLFGIVDIARRVKAITGRKESVVISVSTHVPKPHTPFQWAEQLTVSETIRRQYLIRNELRKYKIEFRYHDPFSTFLEGVFARGDRGLSTTIEEAYKLGCRQDAWANEVNSDMWFKVFEASGIDPHHYLHARNEEDPLPWDHIDCGITKKYFLKEWNRATNARETPDCLTKTCSICGVCDYDANRNVLFSKEGTEKRLGVNYGPSELAGLADINPKNRIKPQPPQREVKPALQRIRIEYSKLTPLSFVGHLELSSVFFRAFRRANIPLAFSRGFHPRPKIAFGPALQLGILSESEFVDIYLTDKLEPDQINILTSPFLPPGLILKSCIEVSMKESAVAAQITAHRFDIVVKDQSSWLNDLSSSLFTNDSWQNIASSRESKDIKIEFKLGDCVSELHRTDSGIGFKLTATPGRVALRPTQIAAALLNNDNADYDIVKKQTFFS